MAGLTVLRKGWPPVRGETLGLCQRLDAQLKSPAPRSGVRHGAYGQFDGLDRFTLNARTAVTSTTASAAPVIEVFDFSLQILSVSVLERTGDFMRLAARSLPFSRSEPAITANQLVLLDLFSRTLLGYHSRVGSLQCSAVSQLVGEALNADDKGVGGKCRDHSCALLCTRNPSRSNKARSRCACGLLVVNNLSP